MNAYSTWKTARQERNILSENIYDGALVLFCIESMNFKFLEPPIVSQSHFGSTQESLSLLSSLAKLIVTLHKQDSRNTYGTLVRVLTVTLFLLYVNF